MRGETSIWHENVRNGAFQSTPLMRGETEYNPIENTDRYISIHSPHARGDNQKEGIKNETYYFNPLPSCEGRRIARSWPKRLKTFQSTPLMRGETFFFIKNLSV